KPGPASRRAGSGRRRPSSPRQGKAAGSRSPVACSISRVGTGRPGGRLRHDAPCDRPEARVLSPAVDGRGELGRRGEVLAAALLQAQGLTIVERNFRCRAGEIDLVALDGATLVFVEGRSRRGGGVGTPFY